jgi:hypothetical protein
MHCSFSEVVVACAVCEDEHPFHGFRAMPPAMPYASLAATDAPADTALAFVTEGLGLLTD